MKADKGLSLVELIVVVAIISIIAVVAVPMYINYQIKSKLIHTDTLARGYINEITDHTYAQGIFPSDDSAIWGCFDVDEKYIAQICKERTDSYSAVVKVYVDPDLISDITDPYYQYNLTIV